MIMKKGEQVHTSIQLGHLGLWIDKRHRRRICRAGFRCIQCCRGEYNGKCTNSSSSERAGFEPTQLDNTQQRYLRQSTRKFRSPYTQLDVKYPPLTQLKPPKMDQIDNLKKVGGNSHPSAPGQHFSAQTSGYSTLQQDSLSPSFPTKNGQTPVPHSCSGLMRRIAPRSSPGLRIGEVMDFTRYG